MPNWCMTSYTIVGEKKDVEKIHAAVKNHPVKEKSDKDWQGNILNALGVSYDALSDSEYEANGYCECHVCGTLEAAKAKMRQLRDAEIENCKAEGRDYEILEDETTELRISWCSHGEQVRLEIHEEEVK